MHHAFSQREASRGSLRLPREGQQGALDTGYCSVTAWFQEEVYPLWAAEKEQGSPGALPLGGGGNHGD